MSLLGDFVHTVKSAASAAGDAIEAGADAVGDAAEDLLDAATDAAGDAVDAVVTFFVVHVPIIGFFVKIVGGFLKGFVNFIRDIGHDLFSFVRIFGHFVGAVLRLDLGGAIRTIGDYFLAGVDVALDAGRFIFGGYFVGGIRDQFQREALREFVNDLITTNDDFTPAVRDRIKSKLKLDQANWGLRVNAVHRTLMLDSANTPLWQWHNDGTLDLYALAGLTTFSNPDLFRPRAWVRSVGANGKDTLWPVTQSVIDEYLADQDHKPVRHHLRVYAMQRNVVSEQIDVATRKHKKLGIRFTWDQGTAITDTDFLTLEIKEKAEYQFSLGDQGAFVIRHGLRTGAGNGEECTALALALFQITEGNHGNTEGRLLMEGSASSPCATAGRTDSCCATLWVMPPSGLPGEDGKGSSVVYRETWPSLVFRYVLAHELGHYFGLCHYGHDGLQNIMYTADKKANLSWFDIGLLNVYMQGEPEFTLDDGRNSWRFIVNQLQCCLDGTLQCGSGPRLGQSRQG